MKAGRLEGWKAGRLEGYSNLKRFCHIPCFQTLPPSRAPQAWGEACVTVFERRSHLGPPAEDRPRPSDYDDDDGYDDHDNYNYIMVIMISIISVVVVVVLVVMIIIRTKVLWTANQWEIWRRQIFQKVGIVWRTMAGCQQAPPTVKIVEQQFYNDQPFSLRSKHLPAQNYPTWSECWVVFLHFHTLSFHKDIKVRNRCPTQTQ